MPYFCMIGLHKAVPSEIWNAGYFFTRCKRCDHDMIRRQGERWQAVPRGQHVVWRRATDRSFAVILPKSPGRESLPSLLNEMGLLTAASGTMARLERNDAGRRSIRDPEKAASH